ncbi:enoyl-CoA hydratase-related protein [Oscillibacter sp.]|uniref:enoyl-CoA hydratase-related protein n=1 Tax=Oscillibacter sp. TaxID=1945593 RepID=UPI0026278969|nr:enoyl-CoA hydratase-related protein [Oscillibacter sp.]MDD3346170.1 enoyl-CoA hydratase-related protein [Oscillibacter sp.]
MALVDFTVKEQIGYLTINRPEAMNALSDEVLTQFHEVLDGIDPDEVRCIIVTGAGDKAFAAGADISQMASATQAQGAAYARRGNDLMLRVEAYPIPTIAAVNGFALGGGCELAMSCDIRLASERAVFGQPEVKLGITPGFGGSQRMARLIGMGRAKELIYTARNVKAEEALSIGLVQAVYPAESLLAEAEKLARRIAANAPIAVRQSKKAMNAGIQTDIVSGVAIEVSAFGECFETADQREGMAAFLEKRPHKPFINR